MTDDSPAPGRVLISPRAISTIAAQAALRSYGVVGMGSRSLFDGLAGLVAHDPHQGVEIDTSGDDIVIDLYVVVEYGTRISVVASSVAHSVSYLVERALGMPVAAVNVHVQDLRVSDTD